MASNSAPIPTTDAPGDTSRHAVVPVGQARTPTHRPRSTAIRGSRPRRDESEAPTPATGDPTWDYREARAKVGDVLTRARHQLPDATQHLEQHLDELLHGPEAARLSTEARDAVEHLREFLATVHTHIARSVHRFEAAAAAAIDAYDTHQTSNRPGAVAPATPALAPIAAQDARTFARASRTFGQTSELLISAAWAPKTPGITAALAKEIGAVDRHLHLHARRMRTAANTLDARLEVFQREPQAPSLTDRETPAIAPTDRNAPDRAHRAAADAEVTDPSTDGQRRLLRVVSHAESVMDVDDPTRPVAPTTTVPTAPRPAAARRM